MTYHRTFIVKGISATDTKGTRVKIIDSLNAHSKIIPFDYTCNSISDAAVAYIGEKGIHITGKSEHKEFTILIA